MKLIGTGLFTKAYLTNDNKNVRLKSKDPIKECMALGFFPESNLFPKIKRLEYGTYEMPYYKTSGHLKNITYKPHIKLYKELRKIYQDNCVGAYNVKDWAEAFRKNISSRHFRYTLIDAVYACGNYDYEIGFEFTPRNLKVHNGRLILLDCFFSQTQASCIRRTKRKAY